MAAPVSLLSDFPRGDPDRQAGEFAPPDARFARPDVIRKSPDLAWQAGKLFLGVIDGEMKQDAQGRPCVAGGHAVGILDDRHMMTIAGSRAGKGRACILPNMLHYPGSVLATDTKGELATITARRRKAMGQDVHVLDPFGVASVPDDFRAGFNPVAAMRDDKLIEDAALIGDALVVVSEKDPHWPCRHLRAKSADLKVWRFQWVAADD